VTGWRTEGGPGTGGDGGWIYGPPVLRTVMEAGGGGGIGSLACLSTYSGGGRDVTGGAG
jgi:hypothetical protein